MRRNFLSARPARTLYQVFGSQQSRRAFATLPTKDDSPPSPIEPSKEQAHPIGPFYESILRTPQPIPKEKPEVPPVTSQQSPAQTPKPAQEEQSSQPAAQDDKPAAKSTPTTRRTRKPRQTSPKDETTTGATSSKAKPAPASSSGPA
ncbi:hypothetical protein VTK56DRAFT_5298 [Thermocarpiscus australiensis]